MWAGAVCPFKVGYTYFSHNSIIFSKFVPAPKVGQIFFPHNHSIFCADFFICFHHNSQNFANTIFIQTISTNIPCSLFESMKKKELRKLLTHFLKVKKGQDKIHNHDTKYKQTLAPAQPEPRRCWAEMSHRPSGFFNFIMVHCDA